MSVFQMTRMINCVEVGSKHPFFGCVMLHLKGFEGVLGAMCRVSAEVAPEKALRSLVFLMTTIRELGHAVAKTEGDAPLEASVLEAAFQVRPFS